MVTEYGNNANELSERIQKLIPDNLEILEMTEANDLLRINEFSCKGLNVSIFQAAWALRDAQEKYRRNN